MKNSLLVFFVINSFIAFAQLNNNTFLPEVMPENPKSFEFLKYGEIPISKYTGLPNVTIPIYTIEIKNLNIPLYLSYHSNGFKVNEEAGWTGLGWTLQGLGSINQIVNGTDDFGYYRNRQKINLSNPLFNLPQSSQNNADQIWVEGAISANVGMGGCQVASLFPYHLMVNGFKDSEPDIFKFSVLDYEGSFILDWENNVFVCLTDKNIKIECLDNTSQDYTPYTFQMTVPNGDRFRFQLKEEGSFAFNSSSGIEGTFPQPDLRVQGERSFRTYMLTQIITNKGEVVNLNYTQTSDYYGYPSVSKQYYFIEPNPNTPFPLSLYTQSDMIKTMILIRQNYSYLSSIDFPGGNINFVSSERIDVSGAKKLDKIIVNGVKTIDFEYGYFIGHTQGTNIETEFSSLPSDLNFFKSNTELTHRLKLMSVTESGKSPYSFKYFENILLPKKTSLASDYWGYYNGVLTNESIFPNIYRFNLFRDKENLMQFENNNKSPSFLHCRAGLLEEIKYPTGGCTVFQYELNKFDNFKIPSVNEQNETKTINISTIPYNISGLSRQKAVIIEGGNTIFKGTASLFTEGCYPQNPNAYLNCYVNLKIFKKEFIEIVKNYPNYSLYGLEYVLYQIENNNLSLYNDNLISNENILVKAFNSPINQTFSNLTYNLAEGIAVFTVNGGCGTYGEGASSSSSGNISHARLTLSYKEYKPLIDGKGAGLRIQSITNYTDYPLYNSNISSKKTYDYTGGKLINNLIYTKNTNYQDVHLTSVSPPNWAPCILYYLNTKKFIFSSSPVHSSSPQSNNRYVGYDKVTEIISNTNPYLSSLVDSNGKIETYFSNTPELNGIGNGVSVTNHVTLPAEIPNNSLENGLIIKEQIYNNNGFKLVEVINDYQLVNPDVWFHGYRFSLKRKEFIDPSHCWGAKCIVHELGRYSIRRKIKPLLIQTTEEKYFESDSNVIQNSKSIIYDSNHQIHKMVETMSDGNVVELEYKYPYNFSSNTILQGMVGRNIISSVIEETTKVNNIQVLKKQLKYKIINTPHFVNTYPQNYAIDEVVSYIGLEDGIDKIHFHRYDNYGNVAEVQKNNGLIISYIWGYSGRYLVAKIENMSYNAIPSSLITAIYNASNEGSLTNALNNLRTSLPNAMVTTLKYIPLVGVKEITDPRGDVIFYEYDSFNRLKSIKDRNGRFISENEYHYRP